LIELTAARIETVRDRVKSTNHPQPYPQELWISL
jgi:hypothetical protein